MSSPLSTVVHHLSVILALLIAFITSAMAEQGAPDSTTNLTSSAPRSSTDTGMPQTSDNAHDGNQGASNTTSLVNYYFVFLALIVAVAGLAVFLMYRRKKKYGAIIRQGRQGALERDLNTWDPIRARRRYWQGRWRSAEHSREEGLNEFGEAPPPYVPKSRDEESGFQHGHINGGNEPAMPMHALSREQAGLKPPDYTETTVQSINEINATSITAPSHGNTALEAHPTAQLPQPTQ